MAQIDHDLGAELAPDAGDRTRTLTGRLVDQLRAHKELAATLALAAIAASVIAVTVAENQPDRNPQDTGVTSTN